jgi:hypothetical protein
VEDAREKFFREVDRYNASRRRFRAARKRLATADDAKRAARRRKAEALRKLRGVEPSFPRQRRSRS